MTISTTQSPQQSQSRNSVGADGASSTDQSSKCALCGVQVEHLASATHAARASANEELVALVQWLIGHVRYRWPHSMLPITAEQRLREIVR